jgi:hypothetical protein
MEESVLQFENNRILRELLLPIPAETSMGREKRQSEGEGGSLVFTIK